MNGRLFVTPLVHPAAITRGRWALEEPQEEALRRLAEYIRGDREPPVWDTSQPPEGSRSFPTQADLEGWPTLIQRGGFDAISYDLETAGDQIICVGMWACRLEFSELRGPQLGMCLRFRRQGGSRYWRTWAEHRAAVELLGSQLADPDLGSVFHNGTSFDVPLLVKHGFQVRGPLLDTMVLSSRAYAEMPKGLQFLATRYLWAPVWKSLVDPDEEAEGKA